MNTKYRPETRVSEYRLEEPLGGGTFGEVWRARHHVWDNEEVAIKLPTEPEYVRYLQQEGIVVHGLRHPNIIRVIGLDPYADPPYLVMELVRGQSLRAAIDQNARGLPIDAVTTILRGVLQAMVAAHEAGVVHRDLKPGNVLLNVDQRGLDALAVDDVKVGDFGLGFSDADTLRSIVMQSASIAREEEGPRISGTLAYMAPELRDGQQSPSPQSDLYSIGVILFELLTGERPAGAELPSALRSDTPAILDEIFNRLYARVDRRFAQATDVLRELDARIDRKTPVATPTPAEPEVKLPPVDRDLHRCPQCQAITEVDDQFCTQCGVQLVEQVLRCPGCGAYPARTDRFCIACGMRLPALQE